MKKTIFVIFFTAFLVCQALATEYWASSKSNKYHYPDCRYAKKIKAENLIVFISPEEAVRAGYVPCKVCKPPMPN